MARTIRKENPLLVHTLLELRQAAKRHDAPVWAAVAERLGRGRHQASPVNIAQLERIAQPKELIAVPGKLLAQGRLTKPVTVGAFGASAEARAKVEAAGGTVLSLADLVKSHPNGTGVRLVA